MDEPLSRHVSVLGDEALRALALAPGQVAVDATVGGGGHTARLAAAVAPSGRVLGLDLDPEALGRAARRLADCPVTLVCENFCDLPEVLASEGFPPQVDAILADLGWSSDQLADESRGFSFASSGPLDLRFNPLRGEPAWKLLDRLSESHLADLIYAYGEERHSRRIARRIVAERQHRPIRTAAQLADLVRASVPRRRDERLDPATRTFQALRIAVNDELKSLEIALRRFPECLKPGGRLAVISFHSLEDRRVKEAFRDDPRWFAETRKPIAPSAEELEANPRARSAKLRVARRTVA